MSVEDHPWIRDRDGVLSFLRAHVGQDIEVDTSTLLQGPAAFEARVEGLGHNPGHVKLVKEAHPLFFYLSEIFAVRETLQTTSHEPPEPDGWVRGDAALAEFFARNIDRRVEVQVRDCSILFTNDPHAFDEVDGELKGSRGVHMSDIERARLAPPAEASTPPEPAADSAFKGAALLVTARPPLGLKDDELIFWRAAVLAAVPLSEYCAEDEPWRNTPVDFADSVVLACRERTKPDTLAGADEAAEPSKSQSVEDQGISFEQFLAEPGPHEDDGHLREMFKAAAEDAAAPRRFQDGPGSTSAAEVRKRKRKRERENPENIVCHSGPSYTTFDDAGEPVTVYRGLDTTVSAPADADTPTVVLERTLADRVNDSASEVPRRECQVVTQPDAPDLEDTARELVACSWYRHVDGMTYARLGTRIPDLASPATLGCIEHVLLREAWGKDVCIDVDEEKRRNLYCCTITVIDDCLLSELRRKGGTALEARAKALVAVLCAAPPKAESC